jgi:hypothetical protein
MRPRIQNANCGIDTVRQFETPRVSVGVDEIDHIPSRGIVEGDAEPGHRR